VKRPARAPVTKGQVFAAEGGRPRPHAGVDFASPANSDAIACFGGIAEVYWNDALGNVVRIIGRYTNGMPSWKAKFFGIKPRYDHIYFRATYAHLVRATVKDGGRVQKGDVIGWTGDTGLEVNGFHLHFTLEVRLPHNEWVLTDPSLWIPDIPRGVASHLTATRERLY